MRTVTAMDLRKRLGEVLDTAAAGERVLIERDHKPLAYLVSVEDGRRLVDGRDAVRERRLQAIEDIVAYAAEMRAKYPVDADAPDAASAVRRDRGRNDPDRGHGR